MFPHNVAPSSGQTLSGPARQKTARLKTNTKKKNKTLSIASAGLDIKIDIQK